MISSGTDNRSFRRHLMKKKIVTFLIAQTVSTSVMAENFNLSIVGVPENVKPEISAKEGNQIFVPVQGKSKILLQEGQEFSVVESNATAGSAAKFQMPNSDAGVSGTSIYSVYARSLGKPAGDSKIPSCDFDPSTKEEVCSLQSSLAVRSSGNTALDNIAGSLLFVDVDVNGNGKLEHLNIFDDRLQNYLWRYDSRGLKILQLRFYQISTDINL